MVLLKDFFIRDLFLLFLSSLFIVFSISVTNNLEKISSVDFIFLMKDSFVDSFDLLKLNLKVFSLRDILSLFIILTDFDNSLK